MNVLSLFSGIGGLDLGLERAGMSVVGQVEIDPFCRKVLAKHWPEVPRHDDVRTCVDWWWGAARPSVDVVAGGFPCQPVAAPGRRLAQADKRWIWPRMRDVIACLRPRWAVIENVPGLRKRGLADVLRDLDRLGYRARAGYVSACAMGAPHTRERMFILAHPAGEGEHQGRRNVRGDDGQAGERAGEGSQGGCGPERRTWWAVEPALGRVAYGIPSRVDRVKALGNAVVPQVAEYIGSLILAADGLVTA